MPNDVQTLDAAALHGEMLSSTLPTRRPALRWIVMVSLAEAMGFAVATVVALFSITSGADPVITYLVVIAGGAIEGTLLGTGQWLAMPGHRPPAPRWIVATAGGAAIAWALGMLPSTLGLPFTTIETFVAATVGAVLLLASIPALQWLALQREDAARWVPVNMGAWLIAIAWTFAPSPFIDESSPLALVASLYVAAGVLMAVTIAALTARTAVRLFPAA